MLDTGWVVGVGMVDRTGWGSAGIGAGIINCGHLVYIYNIYILRALASAPP